MYGSHSSASLLLQQLEGVDFGDDTGRGREAEVGTVAVLLGIRRRIELDATLGHPQAVHPIAELVDLTATPLHHGSSPKLNDTPPLLPPHPRTRTRTHVLNEHILRFRENFTIIIVYSDIKCYSFCRKYGLNYAKKINS